MAKMATLLRLELSRILTAYTIGLLMVSGCLMIMATRSRLLVKMARMVLMAMIARTEPTEQMASLLN
jgi:hypothetical protein